MTYNYLVHLDGAPERSTSISLPHCFEWTGCRRGATDAERLAAVRRCAVRYLGTGLAVVRRRGAGNVVLSIEHAALTARDIESAR